MTQTPGKEPSSRAAKAATIFDVAAAAGVSKSTVSNVVRGADGVAAATRERVLEAIRQLNYRPNVFARQFVQQRTTNLGVVVGDLGNPYFGEIARAVEHVAFRHGYTTTFSNIEGDEHEAATARVEALLEQRVAGIVFLDFVERSVRLQAALSHADIPVVFVGLHESWADSVDVRDEDGGRLATEHLLSIGHRRIAYVRTPLVEDAGDRARYRGYREAMRGAGVRALPAHVWEPGDETIRIAKAASPIGVVLRGETAPTGLFVSNDTGAIALIDACETRGIEVPVDISVIGFDDISVSSLGRISLSTIAFSREALAGQAVATLLERIEGATPPPRHISLPVELRVRGSTLPLPKR